MRSLAMLGILLIPLSFWSHATGQEAADKQMDEIVVVGSGVGVSLDEIESQALPIDVVGEAELGAAGQFTTASMLSNQPAFIGSAENTEAFDARADLNLRGVGSVYTLVLVNGKRFSINGPANVNAIPAAAVERVEILKAGASSVYGADAVAGVVNFVLKDSYDGIGADIRFGSVDSWEMEQYTLHFGGTGPKSSFFALADYYTNTELSGYDRFSFISNDRRPLGGFDGRSSFQNPGRVIFDDGSPNLMLDLDRFDVGGYSTDPADYVPFNDRFRHDRAAPCRDTTCRGNAAFAPHDRFSLVFNGSYDITEDTDVSVSTMYYESNTRFSFGNKTGLVRVPAENFWNPFGEDVSVAWRPMPLRNDAGPLGGVASSDWSSTFGGLDLRHKLSSRFDLLVSAHGLQQRDDFTQPNEIIIPALEASLAQTGPESINVFCFACTPAEAFIQQGIGHTLFERSQWTLYELDARITGDLFDAPAGPIRLVAGLASRTEEYTLEADRLSQSGVLMDTPTHSNQNFDRDVISLFAEARIPLLSSDNAANEPRAEVSVALRYEDYSDFGGTFNPLLSARFFLIPETLVLRGSWNESFRAPLLDDLNANQDIVEAVYPDPQLPGTPLVDVQVLVGGNPELESEDGETLSLGLVYTPPAVPGLFLSFDWWQLQQSNVITEPSPLAILNGEVPGVVQRGDGIGAGGEDIIIEATLFNLAGRDVDGLDFSARYSTEILNGAILDLDFATTYYLGFKADIADGEGLQEEVGTFSPVFGPLPDFRALGTAQVTKGPISGTFQVNWISGFEDEAFSFTGDGDVGSTLYLDLQTRYELGGNWGPFKEGTSLAIGVENVMDEEPQFIRSANFFDPTLYDIRQRWWYISFASRF